jgi:tungstate transport system ATP-binding protein
MQPVYQLKAIKKTYDNREILNLDKLDIFPGEILAIVGPSGVGKSTLLRLLNFLEPPDQGEILYENSLITKPFPLDIRRQITTVFQHPALLHDTVEHNIGYGLRLRGMSNGRDLVPHIIKRLGMEKLARSQVRTLSAGEAQRVALARALVIQPRVLLLDEPTANLDPYNVSLIEEVVREVNVEKKTTIVLVTHNIFQARRLASRVGLLLSGRIIELVSTRDFFENPCDQRTKAFVSGEMVY